MAKQKVVQLRATIAEMEINAQCPADSPQAHAVRYLRQSLVNKQQAIYLAITAMYAPEGAILDGATHQEILRCFQLAEDIFQHQKLAALAKMRLKDPDIDLSLFESPVPGAHNYPVNGAGHGSNNGSALDESEGAIANSLNDLNDDPLAGGNTADVDEVSDVFQE